MTLVFDFRQPQTATTWSSIDDVVMGGMSYSTLRSTANQTTVFSGAVSLENNGGFASMRSPDNLYDLGGKDGLSIRCRGDGKRYGLILRCKSETRLRYQMHFHTEPDLWETVHLAFSRFKPKRLGAFVWGAPPLDPAQIVSVGLIISEGQDGKFALEMEWIAAYPID
jgi:NADH dehydrogenase [ubiquinone] 1 alpha subcomplex assembly factor 1